MSRRRNKKRQLESDIENSSISELLDRVATLEGDLFQYKAEVVKLNSKLDNQEKIINSVDNRLKREEALNKILRRDVNQLEQYSRYNNIRIFGIKDSEKK